MKTIIKELALAALCGAFLGEGLIFLASHMDITLLLRSDQRSVFMIGLVLFSVLFRLLMLVREGGKKTEL